MLSEKVDSMSKTALLCVCVVCVWMCDVWCACILCVCGVWRVYVCVWCACMLCVSCVCVWWV